MPTLMPIWRYWLAEPNLEPEEKQKFKVNDLIRGRIDFHSSLYDDRNNLYSRLGTFKIDILLSGNEAIIKVMNHENSEFMSELYTQKQVNLRNFKLIKPREKPNAYPAWWKNED